MRQLLLGLFVLAAASSAAQDARTFTGVITDSMCAYTGHASMRMGPTDAECVRLCVLAHGVPYVLEVGSSVYFLSDQETPVPVEAIRPAD